MVQLIFRSTLVLFLGLGLLAPRIAAAATSSELPKTVAAETEDAYALGGKIPCTPSDTTHSCCFKQHPSEPEACGGSINQMQQEIDRKQAPRELERADKAHPPEDPQNHVHLKDGTRIRQDGTTKPENSKLSSAVRKWGWPF